MMINEYNNATPEDNAKLATILNTGDGNLIYNQVLKFSFHEDNHNILTYIRGRAYKTFKNNERCFSATSADVEDVEQSVLEGLLQAIKNTEGKFDPEKGTIEAWLFTTVDNVIKSLVRDTYRLQRRGLGDEKDSDGNLTFPVLLSLDNHAAETFVGDCGEVKAEDVQRYLSYSAYWDEPDYNGNTSPVEHKLSQISALGDKLNKREKEVLTILAKTGSFEKTAEQMKMTQGTLRKALARLYNRLNDGKRSPGFN